MDKTVNLYSLSLKETKTYLFAGLFVAGNIILPQVCHLIPSGGLIFLPIYFFTLIAAYKYGLTVGLLTAILSPIVNNLLFAMPPTHALPIILIKSCLLAVATSYTAHKFSKISFIGICLVVIFYQLIGTAIEWIMVQNFIDAVQDIRLGLPGILLQIVGGYALLKALRKV